ncbi:MAG: hypothetical protein ACTHNS_04345 [Marmoricola sp.]
MSTASPLSPTVAADLVRSVDAHRAVIPARHLGLVRAVCLQSAALGIELGGEATGVRALRARSAAVLLLGLVCPWLDVSTRDDLAVVCWEAARSAG